eukprot:TRINITY_DN5615_c0_g1_i5.p1 TRINITY_DN5615_c0_g1~~TRINITY_DN5615_c0_g1_i5.p1  ORF type:complete len:1747 (+),score=336.92 TRINITY_DN5615_c0_g1_i5:29-5269(+)
MTQNTRGYTFDPFTREGKETGPPGGYGLDILDTLEDSPEKKPRSKSSKRLESRRSYHQHRSGSSSPRGEREQSKPRPTKQKSRRKCADEKNEEPSKTPRIEIMQVTDTEDSDLSASGYTATDLVLADSDDEPVSRKKKSTSSRRLSSRQSKRKNSPKRSSSEERVDTGYGPDPNLGGYTANPYHSDSDSSECAKKPTREEVVQNSAYGPDLDIDSSSSEEGGSGYGPIPSEGSGYGGDNSYGPTPYGLADSQETSSPTQGYGPDPGYASDGGYGVIPEDSTSSESSEDKREDEIAPTKEVPLRFVRSRSSTEDGTKSRVHSTIKKSMSEKDSDGNSVIPASPRGDRPLLQKRQKIRNLSEEVMKTVKKEDEEEEKKLIEEKLRVTFKKSKEEKKNITITSEVQKPRIVAHKLGGKEKKIPEQSSDKDWNSEFMELQAMPDSVTKFQKIANLASDFTYAAKIYSMLIISERFLSKTLKTIAPLGLGGVAGGSKYIVHGILFKFALDEEGLYGDDDNAMKAAGHELRGLMCYYNCHIPQLHLPLMCLVDYRGFRLVAMSLLPINKNTLIYGSDDAGKNVHNDDPEFASLMKEAASLINLKGHVTDAKGTIIYGPTDIEGHKHVTPTGEVEYYLVDFARTLPAAYPLPHHRNDGISHHLFEMLRPELVQTNHRLSEDGIITRLPLNSDAFSSFLKHDPDRLESMKEVAAAFKRLTTDVFPQLAKRLLYAYEKDPKNLNLAEEFHIYGVNMRYMGLVRAYFYNNNNSRGNDPVLAGLKKLMLEEMVARVMKIQIKQRFRKRTEQEKTPAEEPYRVEILDFLNEIFLLGDKRETYWSNMVQCLDKKFFKALNEKESNQNILDDLLRRDVSVIMTRWQDMTGITLSQDTPLELLGAGCLRLVSTDIAGIEQKTKVLHIMSDAMATQFSLSIPHARGSECIRLCELAEKKFLESTFQNPTNAIAHLRWGQMLALCARRSEFLHHPTWRKMQVDSVKKLHRALWLNPSLEEAYVDFALAVVQVVTTAFWDRKSPSVIDAETVLVPAGQYLEMACRGSREKTLNRLKQELKGSTDRRLLCFYAMKFTTFVCSNLLSTYTSQITTIDLQNFVHFKIEYLLAFLKSATSLVSITIGNTQITNEEMVQLAQFWTGHLETLKLVNISSLSYIPTLSALETLHLEGCSQLTDSFFTNFPKLKQVSVVSCEKLIGGLLSLTNLKLPFSNIISLDYCRTPILDPEATAMNDSIFQSASPATSKNVHPAIVMPLLEKLNISGLRLDDVMFVELIKGLPSLTSLNISDCQGIGDAGFIAIPKYLPKLQTLIAGNHTVTDKALKALESMSLTHLTLELIKGVECGFYGLFSSLTSLKTLEIGNWTMKQGNPTTTSAKDIAYLNNVIEKEFTSLIWKSSSKHPEHKLKLTPSCVTKTHSSRNSVNHEVCSHCWLPLPQGQFLWACVECTRFVLCMGCAMSIPEKLAGKSILPLGALGWGKTKKSAGSGKDENEETTESPRIEKPARKMSRESRGQAPVGRESLILENPLRISQTQKTQQAQLGLSRDLQRLDLTHWNVSDDVMAAICFVCPNLTSLNIKNCISLTDQTLASIVSLTRLQELNLSHCPFLSGSKIGSMVSSLQNLEVLGLTNCKTANDVTLTNISACTKLRELSLEGCSGITFVGIQSLMFHLKELRVLRLGHLKIPTKQINGLRHTLPEIEISYTVPQTDLDTFRKYKNMGVKDISVTPLSNLGKKSDFAAAITSQ